MNLLFGNTPFSTPFSTPSIFTSILEKYIKENKCKNKQFIRNKRHYICTNAYYCYYLSIKYKKKNSKKWGLIFRGLFLGG